MFSLNMNVAGFVWSLYSDLTRRSPPSPPSDGQRGGPEQSAVRAAVDLRGGERARRRRHQEEAAAAPGPGQVSPEDLKHDLTPVRNGAAATPAEPTSDLFFNFV